MLQADSWFRELTAERKRPTTATEFGSTLTSLLSEPTSKKAKKVKAEGDKADKKPKSQPILALSAKPLPPSQAAERLERRAARVLKAERMERLDRARVRDVVEGWVPAPGAEMGSQEFERALRKTAQRGGECRPRSCFVSRSLANLQSSSCSTRSSSRARTPRRPPRRCPTRLDCGPRPPSPGRRRTTSSAVVARTTCSRRSRSWTLCAAEAPSSPFPSFLSYSHRLASIFGPTFSIYTNGVVALIAAPNVFLSYISIDRQVMIPRRRS